MTTQIFGPGDYGGYNDWAFSGGITFWTNWNTSTFATGVLGRITAIAARWDGYSGFCTGSSGHNDIWNTGTSLVRSTGDFGVSSVGGGTSETMHNASCSDVWQGNASYYIGFWRVAAKCSIFAWKDGAQGGYAGKSADDGNNGGGTVNWGGTTNGGLPVYGTVTVSNVYVRRGGAWTRTYVYVRRSGAWTGPIYVYVRRSGSWTLLNELVEYEIPCKGQEVLVDVGEGLEQGWIVEEGEKSWFGSEDPTAQSWDWTKEGDFEWESKPWMGKYNSSESEEIANGRLEARYSWDQALRWENYGAANFWFPRFQPPILEGELPALERSRSIVTQYDPDPEPILVGCGCN